MSESRAEYVKILDVVHGEGMENPDLFNLLDDMIGEASKLIESNLIALEVPLLIVHIRKRKLHVIYLVKSLRYGLRGAREIRLHMGDINYSKRTHHVSLATGD